MIRNPRLALALAFPVVCLAGLTAYKQVRVMAGTTIVIPIAGFDPRDLLSGHYLTYRLDMGEGGASICDPGWEAQGERPDAVSVCVAAQDGRMLFARRIQLHELAPSGSLPGCAVVLRGRCERGRFAAGIERFYVPEERAAALDRAVRSGKGAVVVAIDRTGAAAVKDLLIDGKPWREVGKEPPPAP